MPYRGPTFLPDAEVTQLQTRRFDEMTRETPLPSEPVRVSVEQSRFDEMVTAQRRPSEDAHVAVETDAFDRLTAGADLPSAQLTPLTEAARFDEMTQGAPLPSQEVAAAIPPPPAPEQDPVSKTLAFLGGLGQQQSSGGSGVGGSWDSAQAMLDRGDVRPGSPPPAPFSPVLDAVTTGAGALGRANQALSGPLNAAADAQRDALAAEVGLPPQQVDRVFDVATTMSGEPLHVARSALGLERAGAAALGQPGMSLEVTGGPDVPGIAPAAPSGEVGRLRLDKFPEDVQDTIRHAAERGDFWRQQRRNVISDDEAERMADDLGRTVEDLVAGGRSGRAYNTEETRALRNALTGQALHVDDLRATLGALGDAASDGLRRDLGEAEARLLALSRVAEGARAEAGRSFRAYLADTRGRLAAAREPAYTSTSRVPTTAAPELGPGVEQSTSFDPLAFRREPTDPGPVPPELGGRAEQTSPFHPLDFMREPVDPGAAAPPNPASRTPRLTEQAPLGLERVATTGQATNLIGETTRVGSGPSAYDRASLVRMAGMLSGVPTHLLNVAGNTVMGGVTLALKEGQVGADLLRVGVGRTLGKDVERQRFQAEVGPQLDGYRRGIWTGLAQVPTILRTGASDAQRAALDLPRGLQSGSGAVDAVVEAPMRLLAASDAVFRSAAFGGHAAALATRKAIQEGLGGAERAARAQDILGNLSHHPDVLEEANRLAARDVFQESRGATDAIAAFKREHPSARVAGDIILPFYKTPYNVAAQGAGMTPAGLKGVLESARRGETGEAVDRAVRATVGTGALLIGLNLAQSNLLTGAYPADEADRSTLPEGWKPYSVRVPWEDGAVYIPVQALGALAVPLGVAAIINDAQQRGVDRGDAMKAVYAGLGGIGQFMFDMSAFQGLNAITKLATQPERSLEAFTESMAASFVPHSALMRQVQQALGDAQRDPHGPLEAFMAAIPGLSQFVREKQTPLGSARARGPEGPTAFVLGSRVGVERDEPTLRVLRAAKVGVPTQGDTYRGYPLTEAEQRAVTARAGELMRERVAPLVDDAEFAGLPLERRTAIVERHRDRAFDAARKEVLGALSDEEFGRRRAMKQDAEAASRPVYKLPG